MNLIFDIGNTFTKVSLFQQGKEIYHEKFNQFSEQDLDNLISQNVNIQHVIISKVNDLPIISKIKSKFPACIDMSHQTAFPVSINYETINTLGNDRIAACVGANTIFPMENVLIIDAGTAITYDFMSNKGIFMGGNISPGLITRFKSLHHFTNKLPLVTPEETHSLTGKSTTQAISGGVWFGMVYEVQGYINEYQSKYKNLKTIITGGDAQKIMEKLKKSVLYNSESDNFVKKLKNSIFVILNLNMIGLNKILEYNFDKK